MIVFDDRHIAVLKVFGFVGTKARVGKEQHIVMQLLRRPLVVDLSVFRMRTGRFVELLVFFGAEPRPVDHLPRGFVWGREIREMCEPLVPNGGLHDLTQGHDLIVDGAACRGLPRRRRGDPVNPVFLNLAGGDRR